MTGVASRLSGVGRINEARFVLHLANNNLNIVSEIKMRILCLLIYLTTYGRVSSSPNIVFTTSWPSGGGTYISEGSCTFTLNRHFAAGEWTMTVTTIQPTLSMTVG